MRINSLGFKIFIFFTLMIIIFSVFVGITYIYSLRSLFTEETYKTIEESQKLLNIETNGILEMWRNGGGNPGVQQLRTVQHFVITKGNSRPNSERFQNEIKAENFDLIKKEAMQQKEDEKRYELKINNSRIFYIIKKALFNGNEIYLVSYMWESYKENIETELLKRLIFIDIISISIAVFFSMILSRYLIKPLDNLKKDISRIAVHDWKDSVNVERKDEIGDLAKEIEEMRKTLIRSDMTQQESLQYISHELKTPVMVIRSYIQSIEDGIFPENTLENSLKIIDKEAFTLEKRIQDLLYFSKIDYMSKHEIKRAEVNIKNILDENIERFKTINDSLLWKTEISDCKINGDPEQLKIAFENIFENQTRYAVKSIEVKMEENGIIYIKNDGEKINSEFMSELFSPFKKGNRGKNGIGLAIVKRIIEIHGGKIKIYNDKNGVTYKIEMK